jgi:hypothetical protein
MMDEDDITLETETDEDGNTVLFKIGTPSGVIEVLAEVVIDDRCVTLIGTHIESTIGPNALGPATLRAFVLLLLQRMDLDEITIEGAARTTGANPGHTPKPIRFSRSHFSPSDFRRRER